MNSHAQPDGAVLHGRGAFTPEARGAFGGFIGPKNLVAQVQNAAPFLFDGSVAFAELAPIAPGARLHEHAFQPLGWLAILRAHALVPATESPTSEERTDYFALCLAAHFASVATYVPTDVDSKIRHALWFEETSHVELERRRALALALARWDVRGVSTRFVHAGELGLVSGHDGERLSVLCGGLLASHAAGDVSGADELEQAIDAELAREAAAFELLEHTRGREIDLLNLANVLTHNAGDIMQAFTAKGARNVAPLVQERYANLARERFERYGGAFGRAALLYRELLASEGHRNYPLREVKLLRASPELLLPLGPFLDPWGAKLARWPAWRASERGAVASAIVEGCKRVSGQESYYRALVGFDGAFPGGLESRELAPNLSGAAKKLLKDSEMRKKLAVRRESFESSYVKRARTMLAR